MLIYIGYISENAIRCYPTRYTFSFTAGLNCLLGDLPAVSNNDQLLAKFHSGILGIIDNMRLMLFFGIIANEYLSENFHLKLCGVRSETDTFAQVLSPQSMKCQLKIAIEFPIMHLYQ